MIICMLLYPVLLSVSVWFVAWVGMMVTFRTFCNVLIWCGSRVLVQFCSLHFWDCRLFCLSVFAIELACSLFGTLVRLMWTNTSEHDTRIQQSYIKLLLQLEKSRYNICAKWHALNCSHLSGESRISDWGVLTYVVRCTLWPRSIATMPYTTLNSAQYPT